MTRVARLAAMIATLACAAAVPRRASAQQAAYRFEITPVDDSLFSFRAGAARWIHRGQRGIAVDPSQRDALVARFTVVRVAHDTVTALITGQTMPVTGDHVALLVRPRTPWFKQGAFWLGTVLGAAVGAVVSTR